MKEMILLTFPFLLLVASADARFKVRGATRTARALQQQQPLPEEVCKLSSTPFTAKVAVTLRGGTAADDNFDGILSSFRESFNISNKQACDPAHRRIVNTQLDSIETRAGAEVTLLVNVEGTYCADCIGESTKTVTDGIGLFGGSTFDGVRGLRAYDEEEISADSKNYKRKEKKKKKQKDHVRSAFKSKHKFKKASSKSKKSASSSPSESPTPNPTAMPTIDPCACTSTKTRRAFEFKAIYQAALDHSPLPKFQVIDIDEVTYVTCDERIEYFDTIVLIELTSPDGSIIPSDEVDLLGDSFVNSYNDLSIELCDDLFRSVQNISLSVENVRRVLREDDSGRALGTFVYTGTAIIKGMCRGFGCSSAGSGSSGSPNGAPTDGTATKAVGLFSNSVITRRLTRHVVAPSHTSRGLLNSGCVCGRTTQQFRAATAEEFVHEYDNTLNDLANQNLLRGVNGATGVTEVFSVDGCDNPTEEFDTVVLIELASGDETTVAANELNVLGDTFATDFNDLTAALCDPIFRNIGNISVEVANIRRRLGVVEGTIRELGTFVFTGRATIKGTCKGYGCSEQVSGSSSRARPTASPAGSSSSQTARAMGLFANRIASRRLLEELHQSSSRNLASGCFCDERTADFRSPTETEFVGSYNESISTLADEGVLENVRGALGVQQILVVSNCAEIEEESFETVLLVNVSAAFQPDEVMSDESFGDALIESYNELSTSLCDPWNRNLQKVSRLPDMSGRHLMGGMISITLSGTCTGKGCSSTVYKHGILTRQLSEMNVIDQTNERPLATSIPRVAEEIDDETLPVPNGCFCGTPDAERRPPTESELISNAFTKIQQETEMVETIVARESALTKPTSRLLRD